MDLSRLGQTGIKDNLENYIQSFSKDAREIFEHFRFDEFIDALNASNLLFKAVQKFGTIDLSPAAVSNHEMGLVFEELIRRFAESSNETAGEHFTPTSDNQNPSRIGIILNGSPLFTGGAGSGESEIRRYILEADLLEAIVALSTDMFYNTGIATYVWVLSNKKTDARKGKVQLINGTKLFGKMRKSLGSRRNIMSEDDIATKTVSPIKPWAMP